MSGTVEWDIEDRLTEMVSRFAASDEVVEDVAYGILEWLDECWETDRLPDESELVGVHRRLTASFGDGHLPTYEERAAGALLMVAADLDSLACAVVRTSAGRDDLTVRSTRYRRAVLEMGLPLRDALLGDLALDLMAEINDAIQDAALRGQVDLAMFDPVREAVEIVRSMAAPRSDEALTMMDAALVIGYTMLGQPEDAYWTAERSMRRTVHSHRMGSTGLVEALQIFGSLGVRAAFETGRGDEAIALAERAESAVRRLGVEVPVEIHIALLDMRMASDPHGTHRLASDLLRARLERGSPHDSEVLLLAQRLIIAACMTEQPALEDLIQYWRTVAAEAPPSVGALELLNSVQLVDDDDNPVGFEMPTLDVPDDLSDLDGLDE